MKGYLSIFISHIFFKKKKIQCISISYKHKCIVKYEKNIYFRSEFCVLDVRRSVISKYCDHPDWLTIHWGVAHSYLQSCLCLLSAFMSIKKKPRIFFGNQFFVNSKTSFILKYCLNKAIFRCNNISNLYSQNRRAQSM